MLLSLQGHFSFVDKYNKLKFTFIDDEINTINETKNKLIAHCGEGTVPFDAEGFTVSLPKGMKILPDDINALVGLDCTVHTRVGHYSFTSKLPRNYGEKVEGTNLSLVDIKRN